MTGKDILQLQLTGSFNLLDERIEDVTNEEWTGRAIPGASLIGFALWHTARIIDWGVHCAIQGVPEVADQPAWRRLFTSEAAYGAGIPDELADRVAHSVGRDQLRRYLGEVRQSALPWLTATSEAELDKVPDMRGHQRTNPRYLDPAIWAEVSSLAGIPAWQILTRPCISHIRLHAGQVDLLIQALRAPTPA